MTLREAKQKIRAYVRAHWDDAKLAEAYAFNGDGNMDVHDYCACLLGVTRSVALHTSRKHAEHLDHYLVARRLPGAIEAEKAYGWLGVSNTSWDMVSPRRNRLSAILRAEMRRRERARHSQGDPQHGAAVTASDQQLKEVVL